jgi:hypothetical protein
VLPLAPRLSPRLVAAIERLDDGQRSIADITRQAGVVAGALGLQQPSYERVRTIVHAKRRRPWEPTPAQVFFEEAYRARPPGAFLEYLVGMDVPPLRSRP